MKFFLYQPKISTDDICQESFIQLNANLFFATKFLNENLKLIQGKKAGNAQQRIKKHYKFLLEFLQQKKDFVYFVSAQLFFVFALV